MGEFEEKLNSILGDKEAMGQIMALARSLGGGSQGTGEHPGPPPPGETDQAADGASPDVQARQQSEGAMPDLSALLGNLDPGMLQMGMRLIQEYQGSDDRNAALLSALRPFLREERRAKLDQALQIARITRLIRVALGAIGGKGEDEGV